jgi:hypothetical protein
MVNEEYEFSFNVKSIDRYIEYCKENNYTLLAKYDQNRKVYENSHSSSIIARVTKTNKDGVIEEMLDCKNVGEKHQDLKISNESLPLIITDDNRSIIMSILEVLDFTLTADNTRTRYVYKKDGVKFEIDDYLKPNLPVVAIEGKRDEVDRVYNEIKEFKVKSK